MLLVRAECKVWVVFAAADPTATFHSAKARVTRQGYVAQPSRRMSWSTLNCHSVRVSPGTKRGVHRFAQADEGLDEVVGAAPI